MSPRPAPEVVSTITLQSVLNASGIYSHWTSEIRNPSEPHEVSECKRGQEVKLPAADRRMWSDGVREIHQSVNTDSSEHLCTCWATQSDQHVENNTAHHSVAPPQAFFLELNQKKSKKSCFFLLSRSLWHKHRNTPSKGPAWSRTWSFTSSSHLSVSSCHMWKPPSASLPLSRSITAVLYC